MNKKFFLIAFFALAVAARGDIIPTLSSVAPAGPGQFLWSYTANVTVDETVTAGDFFTIYDFSATRPTIFGHPGFWSFSSSLLGPTAPLTTPTDDPALWNITFTYINPMQSIPPGTALGVFAAVTYTDQLRPGQFTAEATRANDPTQTKISNIGSVTVPVPEPSSLFPIVSFLGALGIDRFFRRRK